LVLLVLGAASLAAGCFGGRGDRITEIEKQLMQLHALYHLALNANQGKPPANEEQFKALLRKLPPQQLEAMKATDLDRILTSPRDQQKFIIHYEPVARTPPPQSAPIGAGAGPPADIPSPVLAYERTGVGGKRFVLYLNGLTEEVDAAKAKQLNLR
jgi:hypothetical protein